LKRRPAAAGTFYEASRDELLSQIGSCFKSPYGPQKLPKSEVEIDEPPPIIVSPHAGYMYSGPVASHGYYELSRRRRPESIIVIGPNHFGIGTDVSVYPRDSWITPLGEAKIDIQLVAKLAEVSDVFSLDEFSHREEHSIEVQIPFLQFIYGEIKFVPICMLDQSISVATAVGKALAEAVTEPEKVLLIASSDFSHYISHDDALRRDMPVIEKILSLDVEGFYQEIRNRRASLCGYGPIAAVMTYAKMIGYKSARLLKYATSGDITGDRSAVVGYASIMIYR
jgi:AmmeMemoRadiSam system protein B